MAPLEHISPGNLLLSTLLAWPFLSRTYATHSTMVGCRSQNRTRRPSNDCADVASTPTDRTAELE